MPTFNQDQFAAIQADNEALIVSAAAGSGKTTVMVEKIQQTLIRHPEKHISSFLVITFTREAASSMKRKLQSALMKAAPGDPLAARAVTELEGATISTIHAFCDRTIREFFNIADVDPNYRIIEESKNLQLFNEAFQESCETLLTAEGITEEEFEQFKRFFTSFKLEEMRESVRSLYGVLMGIPHPFERLHELLEEITLPVEENSWAEEIQQSVRFELTELQEFIRTEREMIESIGGMAPDKCVNAADKDKEVLENLLEKFPDASLEEKISLLAAARKGMPTITVKGLDDAAKAWYDDFKELRNGIKGSGKLLDTQAKNLELLMDAGQYADNKEIQTALYGLEILMKRIAEVFRQKKARENAIDFADMEQMCYKIICDPAVRETILQKYTDIYVDECQDVSAIQDAIIQSLRGNGNHLFMVGDIKQSIYRFRHAEPRLFMHYRDTFSDAEDSTERRIFFHDNYRSCSEIVDCVNHVFEQAMTREVTELDYEEDDHLHANYPGKFGPVEVVLIDKEGEDGETDDMLEAQCEAVVDIIRRLIDTGYKYRDIAILLRSAKGEAPKIVDHLKKVHIPTFYDGAQTFFGLPEISSFLALLSAIDNDRSDDDLVGALMGLPFNFTDEELSQIRIAMPERVPFWKAYHFCADRDETDTDRRCRAAMDRMIEWRLKAQSVPAAGFIWELMRETGVYAAKGAYPDGRLRQVNLDSLYQKAADLEKRGIVRLSDFLQEMRDIQITSQKEGDGPAAMSDRDDYVRIMTMHKSKGLEYPCVILMNLHKNLRNSPSHSKILMDISTKNDDQRSLGVYMPCVNQIRGTSRDTFGKKAFSIRSIRNSIAEDTRLLYVAMTRAQERLFLIGTYKSKDAARWAEREKISRIWSTRSMLDMIMPAVIHDMGELPEPGNVVERGGWKLDIHIPRTVPDSENEEGQESLDREISEVIKGDRIPPEAMWFGETHPIEPVKTGVSTLVRDYQQEKSVLSHESREETIEQKRGLELTTYRLSEIPPKPEFLEAEKPGAADIGSVTHRFLRLMNLDLFRLSETGYFQIVRTEAARMQQMGIFQPDEVSKIRIRGIAGFLQSDLGKRMIRSPELHREWPFTMQIRTDEDTLVQGIIDAAFKEDDEWVLIDYKTDRDTRPDVFIPRHELQMNWYRTAVERITGKRVKEMWLFALRSGEAFAVEYKDVTK